VRTRAISLITILLKLSFPILGQGFQVTFGPQLTNGEYQCGRFDVQQDGSISAAGYVDGTSMLLRMNTSGSPASAWRLTATGMGPRLITEVSGSTNNSTIVVLRDTITSNGPGSSRRYFSIARVSSSGSALWSTRHYIDVPADLIVPSDRNHLEAAPDGGFFLNTGEPSRPTLMKCGPSGTVLWVRELISTDGAGRFRSLVADADGGCFFLAGDQPYPDTSTVVVGHFTADGVLDMERVVRPSAQGRYLIPSHLIVRQNGHLLVTCTEVGGGQPGKDILLEMGMDGGMTGGWSCAHSSGNSLNMYRALERSDGHLFVDLQYGGYGFAELDANGAVVRTDRFPYQPMGNALGVVEWQQTMMRDDHLIVAGDYFIDEYDTGNDPSTDLLWDLNAFDPGFCGTDNVDIDVQQLILDDLISASDFTASPASIGSASITVTSSTAALPQVLPFCGLWIGTEETQSNTGPIVRPTLLSEGSPFSVSTPGRSMVEVLDTRGRLMHRANLNDGAITEIATNGWSKGTYCVRTTGQDDAASHTVRIVIE